MYALSNLRDGAEPSYRSIRDAASAAPDEVVIENAPGPDRVWDAANGKLRPLTDAERLALAKQEKRRELHAAFAAECEADFGPTPWVAVAVLAGNPQDAKVAGLKTRAAKLRDRLASVEGAARAAEVAAVKW